MHGGKHAERNRQQQREHEPRKSEFQRRRQPLQNELHGRRVPLIGLAEVALQRVAEEDAELQRQRLVEAERRTHGGEVLLASVHRQHERHGIAGEALRHEDDQEGTDDGNQSLRDALEHIDLHGPVSCSVRPIPRIERQNAPGQGEKPSVSRQASVITGR